RIYTSSLYAVERGDDTAVNDAARQELVLRKDVRILNNPSLPQDSEVFDLVYLQNEFISREIDTRINIKDGKVTDGQLAYLIDHGVWDEIIQKVYGSRDLINAIRKMDDWPDKKLGDLLPNIVRYDVHGHTLAGTGLDKIIAQFKLAKMAGSSY